MNEHPRGRGRHVVRLDLEPCTMSGSLASVRGWRQSSVRTRTAIVFKAIALPRHVFQGHSSRRDDPEHCGVALSRRSVIGAAVTSRRVIRCRDASLLRSLGASPLGFHGIWRGWNGCFAGASSLNLAVDGAPAVPSVRALRHKRQAESSHPVA